MEQQVEQRALRSALPTVRPGPNTKQPREPHQRTLVYSLACERGSRSLMEAAKASPGVGCAWGVGVGPSWAAGNPANFQSSLSQVSERVFVPQPACPPPVPAPITSTVQTTTVAFESS